jgi:SulP family sulfate permease
VSVEEQIAAHASGGPVTAQPAPATGVLVYSIDGPLFFGAAGKLERTLKHIQRPATTLILRMGNVPFVDATGIFAIQEIISDFKRQGAQVWLVEVRPNVRAKLERGGVIGQLGAEHIIDTLAQALQRAEAAQSGRAT